MALSRPVSVDYWLKEDVNERYTLDEKLLYLYLTTNEHTEQLGIYKITFKTISNELNMPIERVEEAMNNLEYKHNIIRYSHRTKEVAILDYLTYGLLKGGDVIKKCFDNIKKKVQDMSLLAALYIYTCKFQDEKEIFYIAKQRIREALPYDDKELESMDAFQSPIIEYFYDSEGKKNELDFFGCDNYADIYMRGSSTGVVKVKCYDDKYRFVKFYFNGEQDSRFKNENIDYIIPIDVQRYENELERLKRGEDEIPF